MLMIDWNNKILYIKENTFMHMIVIVILKINKLIVYYSKE